MKAYHGSLEIKQKYVDRMKAHMAADELVRGTGYEDGRGCAVGCTLNAYKHRLFESELGVPEELAHLLDTLHENTSGDVWPTLSLRFLEAIEPGADLGGVARNVKRFINERNLKRVQSLKGISEGLRAGIAGAIQLCLDGGGPAAEAAAWSAVELAARSAVESAVRSVAWSTAESAAAWSGESAARSAAWSAAAWPAESAAEFDAIAEFLIEELKRATL